MYTSLLFIHSLFRWLVLLSLFYGLYRSIRGWAGKLPFGRVDNTVRHSTATIAHIQLVIGYVLYFQSPVVVYFRAHYSGAPEQFEFLFFGLIHIILMTLSIVLITIGSALAKRQDNDQSKFRTMACWFALALIIILIAIPWPFSPLANRPYIRSF